MDLLVTSKVLLCKDNSDFTADQVRRDLIEFIFFALACSLDVRSGDNAALLVLLQVETR